MKIPYFSIIIPTYNKSIELSKTIKIILDQTYKDFEIIVSDNNSSDDTKHIVLGFNDGRIRYFKNRKNLGWILNLEKGIKKSKGKYLILNGDDDFFLSKKTLHNIYNIIQKHKPGFIRLNYLSHINNSLFDFTFDKPLKKDVYVKPKSSTKNILKFIIKSNPYFLTGLCFINSYSEKTKFINSELNPWFRLLFYNLQTFGGYYTHNYFFAAKWVTKNTHPFFTLKEGKFSFEEYLYEVRRLVSKEEYSNFINKLFGQVIKILPLAKVYTGNKNMINCAKRIIYLYPSFKISLFFYFYFFSSLLLPSIVIEKLKSLAINIMIIKNKPVLKLNNE